MNESIKENKFSCLIPKKLSKKIGRNKHVQNIIFNSKILKIKLEITNKNKKNNMLKIRVG